MKCYVKSLRDFSTMSQRDTRDYNIVVDSIKGESGNVTLVGDDKPSIVTGNWLILNGEPYRITASSPSRGSTQLKTAPTDSLFDRDFVYDANHGKTTIGAYIESLILSEWVNQIDAVYATPYISVTNSDTTPFVAPEISEEGIFNLLEYIRMVRNDHGVTIRSEISRNTLKLTVEKHEPVIHPLVIDDGHTKLISADFSNKSIAKLTVYIPTDTGETDEEGQTIYTAQPVDYYLAADGSVSDVIPEERAAGEWRSVTIGKDDDPLEMAKKEFLKNEISHKIEIFSDVQMSVGDVARVNINGNLMESNVTGIYRKKGDTRSRYKLGNLATTVSEKISQIEEKNK